MPDVLAILNEATQPTASSEEYRALAKVCTPYWDTVKDALSLDFVNEIFQAVTDLGQLECEEHFQRGLWLGLRLGQFSEQGPCGGVGDA